jgi:hypothetical protein
MVIVVISSSMMMEIDSGVDERCDVYVERYAQHECQIHYTPHDSPFCDSMSPSYTSNVRERSVFRIRGYDEMEHIDPLFRERVRGVASSE